MCCLSKVQGDDYGQCGAPVHLKGRPEQVPEEAKFRRCKKQR